MSGGRLREGQVEDRELMARFYGCEPAPFDRLTERWWRRLFGYFYAQGLPAEEAEDAALETLVGLYSTKDRLVFRLDQPLEPFLLGIARRIALRAWDRVRRRMPELPIEEADQVGGEDPTEAWLEREALLALVYRLNQQERFYMLNCCKHGFGTRTHGEIAALLGVTDARVSQISKSALARLRDWSEVPAALPERDVRRVREGEHAA